MADHLRTALDWEDVRFFVTLARHRSLSATARALGVTHATVARRVAGLEATLGAALFERRPGGYELTAAGRSALDAASTMEGAANALPRLQPAQPLAGLLRLTATPALAETFLIPRLAAFQTLYPALDIELIAERRSVSLTRREADLALRLGGRDDGELIARRVAKVVFAFYATPKWQGRLDAGERPVFVGFDEVNAALPEAAWLSSQFANARFSFRGNTQVAQAAAARAGCGIALLPRFLGEQDPYLVHVTFGAVPPDRPLWLLTRSDVRLASKIQALRDYLVDLFDQERALFEGL